MLAAGMGGAKWSAEELGAIPAMQKEHAVSALVRMVRWHC